MPATTSPFFGINYGWTTGESGWGSPINSNFQVMSFLDKGAVDDFVAALPASPSNGASVVLTTDNKLYAWFGNWVFITPQNGMEVIKLSNGTKWRFNGTTWIDVTPARSSDTLLGWAYGSLFQLVSATRDINEAIVTANIVWPDGVAGVFTTDVASVSFPGAIDAWHATYAGSPAKTITQPTVTRDAAGAVIAQPAITIV